MIPIHPHQPRTPPRPGAVLREALARLPGHPTQEEIAERMGISRRRLNEILSRDRSITPDTALRLARLLGSPAEEWLALQAAWDLHQLRRDPRVGRALRRIEPLPSRPGGIPATAKTEPPSAVGIRADADSGPEVSPAEYQHLRRFLERRGLLLEAERFARVQTQLEALGGCPPRAERRVRVLPKPPALDSFFRAD